MSKKIKRQARKTPLVTPTSAASLSSNGSRSPEREFNPDYAPVIKDLKRIGMLAGGFFSVLVILAFFLR